MPDVDVQVESVVSQTRAGERDVNYWTYQPADLSATDIGRYLTLPSAFHPLPFDRRGREANWKVELHNGTNAGVFVFAAAAVPEEFLTGIFVYDNFHAGWFAEVYSRLLQFSHSAGVGDGLPAREIGIVNRSWQCVREFFDLKTPTPAIIPNADGGIEFRWYQGGWELQLIVDPDETTFWARSKVTSEIWYGPLIENEKRVREILDSLDRNF